MRDERRRCYVWLQQFSTSLVWPARPPSLNTRHPSYQGVVTPKRLAIRWDGLASQTNTSFSNQSILFCLNALETLDNHQVRTCVCMHIQQGNNGSVMACTKWPPRVVQTETGAVYSQTYTDHALCVNLATHNTLHHPSPPSVLA